MPPSKKPVNNYVATPEEIKAYVYCVRNGIRVSPKGTVSKTKWHIDVSLDGVTWHTSPQTYTEEELWPKYYSVCTYYYNKRKL